MSRIILILVTLALSACATPTRLGISEAEWNNFTPEEQARIKKGAREVRSVKSGPENAVPDGSVVNLKISDGQVNMPPFTGAVAYNPFEIEVPSGACKTVNVSSVSGDKKVDVQICYFNKTIYVDPSRYDPDKGIGSIQLHYSPIWDRGFVYQHVSSSGYAHLNNVNISVRRYGSNDTADSAD